MKKILNRLGQIFAIALLGFLVIFILFFVLLQSNWSREKIRITLEENAKKQGVELTIGSISGRPPFKWTLKNIHIKLSDTNALDIQKLSLRLPAWTILHKHISISSLKLHKTHLTFEENEKKEILSKQELSQILSSLSLPFSFSIKSMKADQFLITNSTTKISTPFKLDGTLRLGKRAKYFTSYLCMSSILYPETIVKLFLQGSFIGNETEAKFSLNLPNIEALESFGTFPVKTTLSMNASMIGSWDSWRVLVGLDPSRKTAPLHGEADILISELDLQALPELNQKWKIQTAFSLFSSGASTLDDFFVESDLCKCKGKAAFSKELSVQNLDADFQLESFDLLERFVKVPLSGSLKAKIHLTDNAAECNIFTEEVMLNHILVDSVTGRISAAYEENEWNGSSFFQADKSVLPFEFSSDFAFMKNASLKIDRLLFATTATKVTGNLSWDFNPKAFSGDLFVYTQDLKPWAKAFPSYPLEGSLGLSVQLMNDSAKAFGNVKNFRCKDLFADRIEIDAELQDVFQELKGKLSLGALGLIRPPFEIYSLDFTTQSDEKRWPFTLGLTGLWKEFLRIETSGVFVKDKNSYELFLDQITGSMLGKNVHLESPFSCFYSPDVFKLNKCALLFDSGRLFTDIALSPQTARIEVSAERLPIDLLALSTPYLSLNGSSSINALLEGTPSHLDGRASIILEEATLTPIGKKTPLQAKGELFLNVHDKKLQLHAFVQTTKEQFLDASATLPINYTLFPFKFDLDKEQKVSGEITMEGRLEEIFDFVNIGSHGATGWINTHLLLSNTLNSPNLQGEIELKEGIYENYYTGTFLKEIDAQGFAEKGKIRLSSFNAEDDQGGSVRAYGQFSLDPALKYPYQLHFDLNDLSSVRFDSISASLTGPLDVIGDSSSALGKGALEVSKAEFKISQELPQDIPVLPVTYINQPVTLSSVTTLPTTIFPFKLDLDLSAPGKVFLIGNGLNSQWQGDVHLTGINTAFLASGKLTLLKGDFAFSGKMFTLTSGEMVFSDKPTQSAFLNLSGTLNIANYTITAYLRGPLTSPQITFQSNPQLPTSSILSYILFNKDVSEISPIQAIQLAQMIVTLSGKAGPDILEAIRKTLGVDRLTIVSSQDSDEVTVQIGKYLTKGLLVTLSQSATSSNIIVEIELAKGFILQAETQEDEQGKFTIKWNRNY